MKSFERLVKEYQKAKAEKETRKEILEQILKRKNFDKLLGFGKQCPDKIKASIINRLIELATTIDQFGAILSLASFSNERKNLGPKILTAAQEKCGVNEKNYPKMMGMERIIDSWLGYNR